MLKSMTRPPIPCSCKSWADATFIKRILLLSLFFFQNCIPYLYHVGKEQIRIVLKKEKIETVLANFQENDAKVKLKTVEDARKFAIEKLFLNSKGGFVYYVKLDRDEIGWNVSASYPLKFQSYEWWFPIIGKVPYKGFFDLEKTKEEEKKLIESGFDTKIRAIGGYSTLGWFSDPIFSNQLQTESYNLMGLVFHEMAHATVYINGDGVFNESYASFIEEEGIKEYYKNNTEVLTKREHQKSEGKLISDLIKNTAKELKNLYEQEIPDSDKHKRKNEIIENFKQSILKKAMLSDIEKKKISEKKFNNEDFIGYLRYNSGGNFFQNEFNKVNGDFKKFHEAMLNLKNLPIERRRELIKE